MANPVSAKPRRFLGWPMVGLAFLLYGFGMAPAYYAWGFLAPEIIADVGLSREQIGNTFGLFTLTFAATSPLAAAAIRRAGLRPTIALGATIAAGGFTWTSLANDPVELLLAYALTGGVGIGLCTLLPVQSLAVAWFVRRRARATGVILLGAGVVGAFVPAAAEALLTRHDWRFIFQTVAAVLAVTGLGSALLIRARPEEVGQHPDGDRGAPPLPPESTTHSLRGWPLARLVVSREFCLLTVACFANTVPWRVVTAHGRLHLEDLGYAPSAAAAILGLRVGLSGAGRLAGAAGDIIDPRRVLSLALLAAAAGLTLFAFAHSVAMAYFSIGLLGLAYGTGMTSEPVSVARVFGTETFLTTNGLRIGLTGLAGWLVPGWVGAAADATGSYHTSFLTLSALCLVGACACMLIPDRTRKTHPA